MERWLAGSHICAPVANMGGGFGKRLLPLAREHADMMRHPGLPICLVAFAGGGREVGVDERAHISPCNMDAW